METVALFGCGKIGHAICALLTGSGRYRIKACDIDPAAAKRLADKWPNTSAHTIDLKSESEHLKNDAQALSLLDDCTAVVSALPYFCNRQVANLAKVSSTHYLDLTEDVESAEIISELAADADVAFVPQCGLAPGVISIVTSFLLRQFDKVDTVKMRVGALPIYPSNLLK